MSKWNIEFYQFSNGNSPILDWFQEQDAKVKAKFTRIFELLEDYGISLGSPYVKPLEDKLYEIRVKENTNK